jgi:O-antigen ligase/tetratricopeptide (TPR) repeat protein
MRLLLGCSLGSMRLESCCDRTVTGGILFLILFTPFAFGSVHPWAFSLMEATLFLLVMVWGARLFFAFRLTPSAFSFAPSSLSFAKNLALPLLLFFILILFQLFPLPPGLLRLLSLSTFEVYSRSLPGWPDRLLYSDLALSRPEKQGEGSREQGATGVRAQSAKSKEQSAPVILPTLDEVRSGAPIPFDRSGPQPATPEIRGQISEDEGRRSDVGGQKSEAKHSEMSVAMSDSRHLTSDVRPLVPETWLPLSVAPALTRMDLLKFAAYGALFFLLLLYPFGDFQQLARTRFSDTGRLQAEERFARSLLLVVLLTGLLVAATGFVQCFSWNGKILWFFVPYDWGGPGAGNAPRASGPFVNPDHFANYLALIFPLALACALFPTSLINKNLEKAFRVFGIFIAFILFIGTLLSLSRSGWITALLGVSILLWFSPWRVREKMPSSLSRRGLPVARVTLIILCVLLTVSLFFVGPGGREQVDIRLGETIAQDAGLWGRSVVWKDTLGMVRDFPLFGVGLGSWPELFPRYQRAPWSPGFYREAHNDYLELLAETGVIGIGLLGWFFFQGGRRLLQGLKRSSPKALPLLAAILAALGVMAFHEFFDFSLQIPANAFLFTLLFALGLRISLAGSREQGAGSTEVARQTGSRVFQTGLPVALCLLSAVLFFAALRQEQIPYPYNLKEPVSVAQAKELLLSHPTHASFHLSLLRRRENDAPLSWQLIASGAALWLEPSNPYIRDLYASTLSRMGRTDEGLREITRSILDSPSLSTHLYLSGRFLPWLSVAEQKAVEKGFKQALARAYPGALDNLAGFYATVGRFSDQGMLYEQVALGESDGAKRADLLINGGLAYVRAARSSEQGAGREVGAPHASRLMPHGIPEIRSRKSEVGGQGVGSVEQEAAKTRNPKTEIQNDQQVAGQQAAPSSMFHAPGSVLNPQPAIRNPKFKDAERLFRNAIAAIPNDPRAYHHLATAIYGPRKNLSGAKEIVFDGIKKGAPPFSLYLSLAEAAHQAGSPEESKAALDFAKTEVEKRAKNGEDPYPLYLLLADGANKVGDREREMAALLEGLELRPRSSDTLFRLANLYLEQRNFDRAVLYLGKIANINPNSPEVYYHLALAEEERYRFAAAAQAYARAVELAPHNKGFQSRYEALKRRVDQSRKDTVTK